MPAYSEPDVKISDELEELRLERREAIEAAFEAFRVTAEQERDILKEALSS